MDRGQAQTLEAVAAGTILLASIVFATQSAAVTPLTSSTSGQHIEGQLQGQAETILAVERENGTLAPAVLLVNNSTGEYHAAGDDGVYANGGPPGAFGHRLNETFRDRGIAFDMTVRYLGPSNASRSREVVDMGQPTDSAVAASRILWLDQYDNLTEPAGPGATTETDVTLNETVTDADDLFYMPDASTGPAFNVVQVEVTVWRM